MRTLFILSFIISSSAFAATCPLGPKDDHMTLQRVMINFGKFTVKADEVVSGALRGAAAPEATDADVSAAVADLEIAAACAEQVATATNVDLLPSQAKKLTGPAYDAYVNAFRQAMTGFKTALDDYARALTDSGAKTPRDLSAASAAKKKVNDLADEAHSHF